MALYFFNIRDGRDVFDQVGTELSSLRQVRIHMVTTATDMVEKEQSEVENGGEWEMEALDEAGRIVATMSFSVTKDKT